MANQVKTDAKFLVEELGAISEERAEDRLPEVPFPLLAKISRTEMPVGETLKILLITATPARPESWHGTPPRIHVRQLSLGE